VLIYEPEPDLRLFVQDAVRELGHEALLACTRAPAAPDVVLVAVGAGMRSVVSRVREAHPALPVICAGTMPGDVEADVVGSVAYLIKPFTLQDLDRALIKALASLPGA
jgi:DNA-binding response OmpR family regulator